MATGLRLSVAIPIHNEESVLPELLLRLRCMLDAIAGGEHEIVFVDDGSTDQTQIMASGMEGGRALRSAGKSAVDSRANLYCVDRIVLNAYFRMEHDPGGFRVWWRLLTGSDHTLENSHLMRMAGRFSRRIRGYAKAHNIPVIECSSEISQMEKHSANWEVAVERPTYDLTIFKLHCGKLSLKIYTRRTRASHRGRCPQYRGTRLWTLVAWIEGRRETESLKSIDKAILRMVSKASGRNKSERKVASKNLAPKAEIFGAG